MRLLGFCLLYETSGYCSFDIRVPGFEKARMKYVRNILDGFHDSREHDALRHKNFAWGYKTFTKNRFSHQLISVLISTHRK